MTRTNDSLTKKAVSVIDEPVLEDTLGIRAHSAALIEFVEDTDTPITIGIQGQWGSGKTSLIKTIRHHFSETRSEVKQISVNAWECSLQSTPEEALVKIVDKIIHEIFGTDRRIGLAKRVITSARDLFRWTLGFAIHFSLGSEAAEMTHKAFKTTEGIQKLREGLETTVKEMATRRTNPYIRVIIYVDDLDRIEPKNAVAILELLKNIFTVKGCVFILAIDYDVVVKGLEDKFGKPTPENDWEFRAFFDKIIQLPFLMPMNEYDIGEYVNTLLLEIDFVTEPLDEDDVTSIVRRTIGNNPRSIKRLINALSLARILTKNRKDSPDTFDAHDEESKEKLLLFSLFCLQIAYPEIYELLRDEPDFLKWDDNFAFEQTQRSEERVGNLKPEEMKRIFEDELEGAKKTKAFGAPWQQALYRVCYGRPRLKARARDISEFFSYIEDDLFKSSSKNIGEEIERLLPQTSVTSVLSTKEAPKSDRAWKSKEDKESAQQLWKQIFDGFREDPDLEEIELKSDENAFVVGTQERIKLIDVPPEISAIAKVELNHAKPYVALEIYHTGKSEEMDRLYFGLEEKKDGIERQLDLEGKLQWDPGKGKPGSKKQIKYQDANVVGKIKELKEKGVQTPPQETHEEVVDFFKNWVPKFVRVMSTHLKEIEDDPTNAD